MTDLIFLLKNFHFHVSSFEYLSIMIAMNKMFIVHWYPWIKISLPIIHSHSKHLFRATCMRRSWECRSGKWHSFCLQRVYSQDVRWGEQFLPGAHFSRGTSLVAFMGRRVAVMFRAVWNEQCVFQDPSWWLIYSWRTYDVRVNYGCVTPWVQWMSESKLLR